MKHRCRPLLLIAVVAWMACAPAACTAIPVGAFDAWAGRFDEVRTAGEAVLLDFDAARREAEVVLAPARDEPPDAADDASRLAFDAREVVDEEESLDAVGVRLRAWDVIGRYNEALRAVADGRDVQRIAAAVDGMHDALAEFPLEAVADLATDVAPFAGVARLAAQAVQREADARRFAAAVRAARPAVEQFLRLLEADAQSFYDLRLALRGAAVDALSDGIVDRARAFVTLAATYDLPPHGGDDASRARALAERINRTLRRHGWPAEGLVSIETSEGTLLPYTEAAHRQLESIADQINALAAQIVAADETLLAYREVMVRYVRLIRATGRALVELADALDRPRAATAVGADALRLAVSVRRALHAYQHQGDS